MLAVIRLRCLACPGRDQSKKNSPIKADEFRLEPVLHPAGVTPDRPANPLTIVA